MEIRRSDRILCHVVIVEVHLMLDLVMMIVVSGTSYSEYVRVLLYADTH
jgi:hypothetical protein